MGCIVAIPPTEPTMNMSLSSRPAAIHFVAATLAGAVAIALVAGTASLFLHDGKPMQQLVAAERACADRAYVSERDACMREFLPAARAPHVASQ
jgi:hypothetical protein